MLPSLTLFCSLAFGGAPPVESVCHQVAPAPTKEKWTRTREQTRAVVLIHGFHYHVLSKNVPKAEFRPWQKVDAALVKEVAKHADVYVFAYGQNVPLDTIVSQSKLGASVAQLRNLGYGEVVLVGHSAGGLIARHFVEDFPNAGVTKVIQVCAPNGGSPLATVTAPKAQKVFLECLTEKCRQQCMKDRAAKLIPDKVQFLCVVARGDGTKGTDGVVPCVCQWTADLQKQGIPVVGIMGSHREAVRDAKTAETLAELIRANQPRWPPERIEKAKRELLGK